MYGSEVQRGRYARHLALTEIGVEGQQRLQRARVLIVGAGGLGCPAALYLAAAGIGQLGIVDFDLVDESNLQRQVLFTTADLGTSKAVAARTRLLALNPTLQIHAHAVELCAANVRELFADYDIVVDGSDRVGTRYLVNDACVLLGKALIWAAVHRFEGQAMTCLPGRGPCYRCLFPEPALGMVPNCADIGVLGVLPGVLGSLQATEVIKLVTGVGEPLLGRLLTYDALSLRFEEFRCRRRADCAVCGDAPSILAPLDPPGFCSLAELAAVPAIAPRELARRLNDPRHPAPALIDVRAPQEFARGHLAASINVPLTLIEQRPLAQIGELAGMEAAGIAAPVFVCLSGVRSRRACAIAHRAGWRHALQLEGGLQAWHDLIDPTLAL